MKKFAPFLLLVPVFFLVLIFFYGCGVTTNGGGPVSHPRIFVTGSSSNEVYVLDATNLTVEAIIALPGGSEGEWMSLSPNGKKIYISDNSGVSIYSVNVETLSYEATFNLTFPNDVAFISNERAVAASGINGTIGLFWLIDAQSDTTLACAAFIDEYASTQEGIGVALNPNNNRIYVAARRNKIFSFDVSGDTITQVSTIDAGSIELYDICFPPGSDKFFVTKLLPSTGVIIFSATNESYVNTLTAASISPRRIAASPDGNTIYIGNQCWAKIETVDVKNPTTLNVSSVSISPMNTIIGMAVSPDSSRIYAYCSDSIGPTVKIVVFDTSLTVIASVELPADYGKYGAVVYVP